MISTIFSTISRGLTGSEWDTTLAIGRDLHGWPPPPPVK